MGRRATSRTLVFAVVGIAAAACGEPPSQPDARQPDARQPSLVDARAIGQGAVRPQAVRIVAAGDISREQMGDQERTARLVHSLRPIRALGLGDLQYPSGGYRDFMRYYDRTWGRFNDKMLPAPGNHEYETPGAQGYLRYFGRRVHPSGHTYFSRNLADWHIVSLDSNLARGRDSSQLRWLRRDLRSARQDCALAFWHHPLFSSGTKHGGDLSQTPFWRVLYRARADVILNGHEHHYERFGKQRPSGRHARHGIREFVVGTGGAGHYPFGPAERNSQKRITGVFGVLALTLHPHAYGWRFVAVGGKVRDRGREACN